MKTDSAKVIIMFLGVDEMWVPKSAAVDVSIM